MSTRPSMSWLSSGLEHFLADLHNGGPGSRQDPVDYLIVGSGYGGSLAAAEISAQRPNDSVHLFERGKEYLPGMFPSSTSELTGEVRLARLGTPGAGGNPEGLFDVHVDDGVSTVCANGLGGGSLINAAVMRRPEKEAFTHPRWPASIDHTELDPYYTEVEQRLGSRTKKGKAVVFSDHKGIDGKPFVPSKAEFLKLHAKQRSGFHYEEAALSLAVKTGDNQSQVRQNACIACGDCATGCNHDAKNSLDSNLLVEAVRNGAIISTGATVLKVEKCKRKSKRKSKDKAGESLWMLHVVYTNPDLRIRDNGYKRGYPKSYGELPTSVNIVYCRNILLCAGTLGSTEILKRSAGPKLPLSPRLGDNFSTNGDMLAFCDTRHLEQRSDIPRPKSVARQQDNPKTRFIGPTICGVVTTEDPYRSNSRNPHLLIEEMAVPGPLEPLLAVGVSLAETLRRVSTFDGSRHRNDVDPARQDTRNVQHTGIYAIMGDDSTGGTLEMEDKSRFTNPPLTDGYLRVHFKNAGGLPMFQQQLKALRALLQPRQFNSWLYRNLCKGTSERLNPVFANPAWRLPSLLSSGLRTQAQHVVTVHPLGGCCMAETHEDGVVNEFGQVFDASGEDPDAVLDGLFVLDGSIIPTALAANPAVTISALTMRALKDPRSPLRRQLVTAKPSQTTRKPIDECYRERPRYRDKDPFLPAIPSRFEIIERMHGNIRLQHQDGGVVDKVLEITLRFQPITLDSLYEDKDLPTRLKVNTTVESNTRVVSQIRIFEPAAYTRAVNQYNRGEPLRRVQLTPLLQNKDFKTLYREQTELDTYLANTADLTILAEGSLDVFHRESSSSLSRIFRLISQQYRWKFWNLAKPAWKWVVNRIEGAPRWPLLAMLSHAADRRFMTYKLYARKSYTQQRFGSTSLPADLLKRVTADDSSSEINQSAPLIIGKKTIEAHASRNIWQQLTEIVVEDFPCQISNQKARLSLDLDLLTQLKIPLMRVASQYHLINTKQQLVSLGGYLTNLLAPIALPVLLRDEPETSNARPNRFPQRLDGVPEHDKPVEIIVGHIPDNTIDELPKHTPVKIRLTRYRQQSNKPPVLLLHGYSASGSTFAHNTLQDPLVRVLYERGYDVWVLDMRTSCAMATSIYPWNFEDVARNDIPRAINYITDRTSFPKINIIAHCMGATMFSMAILDRKLEELKNLNNKINCCVLSQVPPVIRPKEAGRFRAFFTSYMKTFIPRTQYSLAPGDNPQPFESALDRLLRTLPYPADDATEEQRRAVRKAGYQRTRRRLDLLYTRTFHLKNVLPKTLEKIDDLFGPLNTQTIAQSIHFTRRGWLTDRIGKSLQRDGDTDKALRKYWTFPTFVFVGADNSLFEPRALCEFQRKADQLRLNVHCREPVEGYGHQDAFLAKDAKSRIFDEFIDWMEDRSIQISTPRAGARREELCCYRIRGKREMRGENTLRISIHRDDLVAANYYVEPTLIGMWVEPITQMPDSFYYCDYADKFIDPDQALLADGKISSDEQYYWIEIPVTETTRNYQNGSARFFFTSNRPIPRAAEIKE